MCVDMDMVPSIGASPRSPSIGASPRSVSLVILMM